MTETPKNKMSAEEFVNEFHRLTASELNHATEDRDVCLDLVTAYTAEKDSRISQLEADNARLRQSLWRLDDLLGDVNEFLADFDCLPPTLTERIKAALEDKPC